MNENRYESLLTELSGLLRMSATEKEILALLLETREKLRIEEIIKRLERSERAVRKRIMKLHEMKLIDRECTTTDNGQQAYQYFATPLKNIIRKVREKISSRLTNLENKARSLRGEGVNKNLRKNCN